MNGNLHIPPAQWLEETFEFENCAECGKDGSAHDPIPFLGNWFARCRSAP